MAGFEVYFEALEECAGKAKGIGNQFKADADEGSVSVARDCFGKIEGTSGPLADAIGKLQEKIVSEIRYVEQNLTKVETSLYQVATNLRNADPPKPREAGA
ncbi:hypothetical protein [Microtetraspora sp. NBRC 16547]|uniref:hypothetical protein n=1 Tax=Microtetraspora sp. NBRC 16547 TaxID=3030993 RepID=UPI0024A03CC5|nr:hypothetical protein [Microtetraspora sp. NBRC 16547]GLX02139.1 hypothetical protein Misp02_62250 [Microtetraspora sp. NBRC 16547]